MLENQACWAIFSSAKVGKSGQSDNDFGDFLGFLTKKTDDSFLFVKFWRVKMAKRKADRTESQMRNFRNESLVRRQSYRAQRFSAWHDGGKYTSRSSASGQTGSL